MNYLVTHYKNLAEQLQARINHIQRCLYEMDATAAGGGIDQLRVSDMQKSDINPVSYQTNTTSTRGFGSQSPLLPIVPNRGPKAPPALGDYFISPISYEQGPRMEDYPSGSNPSWAEVQAQWLRQRNAYDLALREHERYLERTKPRKTKDR